MTSTYAAIALSAALVTAASAIVPAKGADLSGRGGAGTAHGRSGAAVPAPMPIEETYKYYVGVGIGYNVRSSGDTSLTATAATSGFRTIGPEDDHQFVTSLTAGRYITPSLRVELGLDLRAKQRSGETYAYRGRMQQQFASTGVGSATTATNMYNVTRSEEVSDTRQSLMLNFLYDFNRGGRLTPYIGAGIGATYHTLERYSTEVATCDSTTSGNNATPAATGCNMHPSATMPMSANFSGSNTATGWGLTGALMAGVTYNLNERTHLDLGYRLMHQGGKLAISTNSLGGISTLNVGARTDHELRTGVRFDLY